MTRARWGLVLVLILAVAGGASCGKQETPAVAGGDSTGAGAAGSTAVAASTPEAGQPAAAPDTLMLFTYAQRRGMRIFRHYCVVCHGEEGAGDGFNAYNLDPAPRDLTDPKYQNAISDETLTEVVTQGGRGMNKSILMPAYGKTLSKEQISDLVAFIRTLSAGGDTASEAGGS